jgi:hypothetical protein
MMTPLEKVVANVSKRTGLSASEIKCKSPEAIRSYITKSTGKPLTITTEFPHIGRGNVLRDGIVSSSRINRDIDKILGV